MMMNYPKKAICISYLTNVELANLAILAFKFKSHPNFRGRRCIGCSEIIFPVFC